MKKELRTAVWKGTSPIEAYRFEGIAQPFPNHFHAYYVIGLVEDGERVLSCKGREYTVKKGNVLLPNPGDSHACVQHGGGTLDYRTFNLTKEAMLALAEEAAGRRTLPGFSQNVIRDPDAARCLRSLHERIMGGVRVLDGEDRLPRLLSMLIRRYGQPLERCVPECRAEVERACVFLERHYAERICLDEICRRAGLSRSALLRAFTRAKGVTPYCYLKNIRIIKARALLEQGAPPVEAALRTGFSDQSHFTNEFSRLIGLPPGAYREMFKGMERGVHGK